MAIPCRIGGPGKLNWSLSLDWCHLGSWQGAKEAVYPARERRVISYKYEKRTGRYREMWHKVRV